MPPREGESQGQVDGGLFVFWKKQQSVFQSYFSDEKVESSDVEQLVIRGAGTAALQPELLTNSCSGQRAMTDLSLSTCVGYYEVPWTVLFPVLSSLKE